MYIIFSMDIKTSSYRIVFFEKPKESFSKVNRDVNIHNIEIKSNKHVKINWTDKETHIETDPAERLIDK